MSFIRRKSSLLNREEDSFIVSDSEDEDKTPVKSSATSGNAQVINDSDSEGDTASNSGANNSDDEGNSGSLDSEEEDRQFMNSTHMVSIIESSSDSESDSSEEKVPLSKLKRHSIYDNPVKSDTPKSESTPLHGIKRKRIKRAVIYSDSESENVSAHYGDEEKSTNKSRNKVLAELNEYSVEEESNKNQSQESHNEPINGDDIAQSIESSEETSSNYQNLDEKSRDSIGSKSNSIYQKTDSFGEVFDNKDKLQVFANPELPLKEKSILNKRSMYIKKKTSVIDLTMSDDLNELNPGEKSYNEDKKASIVDLTVNPNHELTPIKTVIKTKNTLKTEKQSYDEVLVSSTSTSENEIDEDVLKFVKKEVGVSNIDPVAAQKKEHYLLQINMIQEKVVKLEKFIKSYEMDKLPDKGAKVVENLKKEKQKIVVLNEKISKLSRKSCDSQSRISQLPTIKNEPNQNVRRDSKSRISQLPTIKKEPNQIVRRVTSYMNSSDEDKENLHVNKKLSPNNFVKEESDGSYEDDDFDVNAIPNVPQTSFDPNDLGKKALATLNKQQSLTVKRLEQLHGSLTSRPSDDARDKDPYGLKIPLMPHQQHALAWMKWREQQKPKGGILADDMGLGKTLTMISLVLANLNEKESSSDDSSESSSDDNNWITKKKKHKRYYGGTLVVCPASLINQWESEVKNRCKRGLLSVLVFHGNRRNVDDRKLAKFNIVITTYQTLVREAELETGMYKMEWNRVILDEAHYVRNHKSKACLAVCGLYSKHRWALTGTPIQNKELDLYAILKFLQCSPFDDLHVWKRWVDNRNDAGKQRLITIMKTLMLRRTKQELQAKGSLESLPEKTIDVIEVDMDREETLAYQKILLFSQNLFAQFLAQRADKQHTRELYGGKFDKPSNYGAVTQFTKAQKVLLAHHSTIEAYEILVLLLRLRQMCCHPALVHAMLDKEDAEVNGVLDQEDDSNNDLLQRLSNMSINEEEGVDEQAAKFKFDDKVATNLLTKRNPVFDDDRHSSKVRKIIETVQEIIDKDEKLIIVSQWSSFLRVIAKHLRDVEDAKYEFFTGDVPVKKRQDIVDKLNDPRGNTNILLLSLTAGGVGLNLVGANHLLLVDIHWNPQLEAQAQDRIYRFGQKKNVHIYKFICKESIEERVKALQDKKIEIANHVLTGTRTVSSKLTIDDLKLLFS